MIKLRSYILTNYQRPKYLTALLQSLIKQNIEINLIDNGNNIKKDNFEKINIITKKFNTGASDGMKFLFQNLTPNNDPNDYTIILDDDLLLEENFVENLNSVTKYIKIFQDNFLLLSLRVNKAEWLNQIRYGHLNYDFVNSIFNRHFAKNLFYKYAKTPPLNNQLGRISICECDKGHFGGLIIPSKLIKFLMFDVAE